jgi:hypothetical protein
MFVNVLNPEIPALASNAAVELDLLINDEPTDLKAVYQLGERLNNSLDKSMPSRLVRLHANTETETILGQAFLQVLTTQVNSATILSEVARRTEEIAQQLSSDDLKTQDKKALEMPRAFCLVLSQLAAAYRQSILETPPYHPLRR